MKTSLLHRLVTTVVAFVFFPVVVMFAVLASFAALAAALEKVWTK